MRPLNRRNAIAAYVVGWAIAGYKAPQAILDFVADPSYTIADEFQMVPMVLCALVALVLALRPQIAFALLVMLLAGLVLILGIIAYVHGDPLHAHDAWRQFALGSYVWCCALLPSIPAVIWAGVRSREELQPASQ